MATIVNGLNIPTNVITECRKRYIKESTANPTNEPFMKVMLRYGMQKLYEDVVNTNWVRDNRVQIRTDTDAIQ